MTSLSREFVRHEFDDLRRELGDVRSLLRELAVRTRNVEAASSNVVDDLAALATRGESFGICAPCFKHECPAARLIGLLCSQCWFGFFQSSD